MLKLLPFDQWAEINTSWLQELPGNSGDLAWFQNQPDMFGTDCCEYQISQGRGHPSRVLG